MLLFVPTFDSKFRGMGLLNAGFRKESIANTKFPQFRLVFGADFYCFLKSWEHFFLIFVALETGLKINRFSVV